MATGRHHIAMIMILVPAFVRLMMAPRDDVWTFVLVMTSIAWAASSFAVSGDRRGFSWSLVPTLLCAAGVAAAEVWRWIRHHRY